MIGNEIQLITLTKKSALFNPNHSLAIVYNFLSEWGKKNNMFEWVRVSFKWYECGASFHGKNYSGKIELVIWTDQRA